MSLEIKTEKTSSNNSSENFSSDSNTSANSNDGVSSENKKGINEIKEKSNHPKKVKHVKFKKFHLVTVIKVESYKSFNCQGNANCKQIFKMPRYRQEEVHCTCSIF